MTEMQFNMGRSANFDSTACLALVQVLPKVRAHYEVCKAIPQADPYNGQNSEY